MILRQINGNEVSVKLEDYELFVKNHFDNPYNYTSEIISEFNNLELAKVLTHKYNTVLDIGANIGLFALHIMPIANRIICLEPTPEHFAVQNALLKNYKNKVLSLQAALHNYTGQTTIFKCGINSTMNALMPENRENGFPVNCFNLKGLCDLYDLKKVDLCKIDIEGGEMLVLNFENLKEAFDIIDNFIVELHPRSTEVYKHFERIFSDVGYKCKLIDFNCALFASRF